MLECLTVGDKTNTDTEVNGELFFNVLELIYSPVMTSINSVEEKKRRNWMSNRAIEATSAGLPSKSTVPLPSASISSIMSSSSSSGMAPSSSRRISLNASRVKYPLAVQRSWITGGG